MKKDNRKSKNNKNSNKALHFVGVCFFCGLISLIFIYIIGGCLALQIAYPYTFFVIWGCISPALLSGIIALVIAKRVKKRGVLIGAVCGLCVFGTVCLISLIAGQFALSSIFSVKMLCCVLTGSFFGIIGVQQKRAKRG